MQIILYGFNPTTFRFTIEVNGQDYTFTYKDGTGTNFRDATNKLIARTYKGFRNCLGILGGSVEADKLTTEIRKASQALDAHEYALKKRATGSMTQQAGLTVMTWKHSETQYAAMPIFDTLDLTPDPIFYGDSREGAIAAYLASVNPVSKEICQTG